MIHLNELPMRLQHQPVNKTTIDTQAMQEYLLAAPRYHECGIATGVSDRACQLLARTDLIEFELRQFVGGRTKSLHRLNHEIRQFLTFDERPGRVMTAFVLGAVEQTLLDQEWYEAMTRLQTARKRIQHHFQIDTILTNSEQ